MLELSKTYNLQINGNDVLLNDNGLQMVGYTGKKDVHTLAIHKRQMYKLHKLYLYHLEYWQ